MRLRRYLGRHDDVVVDSGADDGFGVPVWRTRSRLEACVANQYVADARREPEQPTVTAQQIVLLGVAARGLDGQHAATAAKHESGARRARPGSVDPDGGARLPTGRRGPPGRPRHRTGPVATPSRTSPLRRGQGRTPLPGGRPRQPPGRPRPGNRMGTGASRRRRRRRRTGPTPGRPTRPAQPNRTRRHHRPGRRPERGLVSAHHHRPGPQGNSCTPCSRTSPSPSTTRPTAPT